MSYLSHCKSHVIFLLVLPPRLIQVMCVQQGGSVQCYCINLWLASITPMNYVPSFCLVKSSLTNRDLGEGAAHRTDIFHRHLLTNI